MKSEEFFTCGTLGKICGLQGYTIRRLYHAFLTQVLRYEIIITAGDLTLVGDDQTVIILLVSAVETLLSCS